MTKKQLADIKKKIDFKIGVLVKNSEEIVSIVSDIYNGNQSRTNLKITLNKKEKDYIYGRYYRYYYTWKIKKSKWVLDSVYESKD